MPPGGVGAKGRSWEMAGVASTAAVAARSRGSYHNAQRMEDRRSWQAIQSYGASRRARGGSGGDRFPVHLRQRQLRRLYRARRYGHGFDAAAGRRGIERGADVVWVDAGMPDATVGGCKRDVDGARAEVGRGSFRSAAQTSCLQERIGIEFSKRRRPIDGRLKEIGMENTHDGDHAAAEADGLFNASEPFGAD